MFGIIKLTGEPHEGNPVLSLEGVYKMIGVYKITNKINGKMYIGASINISDRKTQHFKPYRVNKYKDSLPLYQAIDKFGRENFSFEIIEETTVDKLDEREEHYIKEFNSVKEGYNVVATAHNMNDEEHKKVHGKFFSEWNKKQWQNEEYRKERSEHSSLVQKERLKDPRYLAEKSKQLKKYTDSIKKPIEQYDKQGNLIAVYDGVREAERATGIGSSQISAVALGKPRRKSAGGFVWKYPQ